jgi:hypothetical protein
MPYNLIPHTSLIPVLDAVATAAGSAPQLRAVVAMEDAVFFMV